MEKNNIPHSINLVRDYLNKNYSEILEALCLYFRVPASKFILEKTLDTLLDMEIEAISTTYIDVVFQDILNKEIRSVVRTRLDNIAGPVYNSEFDTNISLNSEVKELEADEFWIDKKTKNLIKRRGSKLLSISQHKNLLIKTESNDSYGGFESFWTAFVEKQVLEENNFHKKSKKKLVLISIILGTVIFAFFIAAFINSYKPLVVGDMTYGTAIKRLLSKTRVFVYDEKLEPPYLSIFRYNSINELKSEYPQSFLIQPQFIPDGYSEDFYNYMTHSDGYTTAIYYRANEFATFNIKYAVREDYDPFHYRINYYKYDFVDNDGNSFYFFREDSYYIVAAFFLDDIYVTINGQSNYPGTDIENLKKIVSSIVEEYQGTVTD